MPAVWTNPITWNVDQLVTNDDLNEQVRDNLEYLLSPNHDRIIRDNGGDYAITNIGAFQDIDSTNLSVTLVTHGGPVLAHFQGIARTNGPANPGHFDIAVNGTRIGAAHTLGLLSIGTDTGVWETVSMLALVTGLAAGTHIFRPQWRNQSSATLTLRANSSDNALIFEGIEL